VRLVFVGKDGIRKGLDRLLGALAIARGLGSRIELRVIGCEPAAVPPKLRNISGVEWAGFISKQPNSRRFITAVSECDIGCLLSRAEAGGSSVFEFHALGLAVLGTNAGGSAEQPIPEASVVVDVEAADDEVASILMALEADPERLGAMRNAAWERRHTVLWPSRAREIGELMDATDHQ
jgi:glycosyltransferase involved in cell wall biosynthesis